MAWCVAFSIYLDIAMSESQGRTEALPHPALQRPLEPWMSVTGSTCTLWLESRPPFYSFRMLQQLLLFVSRTSKSNVPSYIPKLLAESLVTPASSYAFLLSKA